MFHDSAVFTENEIGKDSGRPRGCFAVVVWCWTSMPCQVVSDVLPPMVGPQVCDLVTNDASLKFALQLTSSTTKSKSKAPTRNPRRIVTRML